MPVLISKGTIWRGWRKGKAPEQLPEAFPGPTGVLEAKHRAAGYVLSLAPCSQVSEAVGAQWGPLSSDSPPSGPNCIMEGRPLPLSGSCRKQMWAANPNSSVPDEAFSHSLFNPIYPKYYHFNIYSVSYSIYETVCTIFSH